jgi:phospholipid/cholesterol/gamma-HCH transport system substrate-binding protein
MVEIAIERRAPIRSDTKVGIEFQGLAGAPVVSLSGGSASLPPLASASGEKPLLVAEKGAGLGMTQAARDVLRHIDAVVTDNAEPVRSLIGNIDKFAGALARNSDRVDTIVAGLERLTGGGAKSVPRVFDLAAAKTFPGLKKRPTAQLVVLEPTVLAELDTEKILVRRAEAGERPAPPVGNWPDVLPKVVQARIVQSFENADYLQALGRVPDATRGDFQLLIDIRAFQVNAFGSATAEIEVAGKIVNAEGRIVGARLFSVTRPVTQLEPELIAAALNAAFEKIASDIVLWTCETI